MILKMQLQFHFRNHQRWIFYLDKILSNFSEKCQESKRCTCIYAWNKCNACRSQLQNFSKIFIQIISRAVIQNALSSIQFSKTKHNMVHLYKLHLMNLVEAVLEVQVNLSAIKFHLSDLCKEFYFLLVSTKTLCLRL